MGTVSNRGTKDRPMWYCRYIDADGKRKQRPTKQTTKAAAIRFVVEIEARVARGLIGIPEVSAEEQKAKALTVGELAERFLQEYSSPRLKDRKVYMGSVGPWVRKRLLPYPLASMAVVDVRKLHVAQYRDRLCQEGFKPSSVSTWLHFLSKVFTWCADSEIINIRNPCSKIELPRTAPSEKRYTRAECERLLADADPKVATALYTGMRHGELCGLRWSDVRFDLGCIEIKRSFRTTPKSGKARTIPLHSDLAPILKEWRARCPETPEALVFPVAISDGTFRMGRRQDAAKVRSILVAAGCPDDYENPYHAMRHSFSTLLAESHASIDAISRMLGHSGSGSAVTRGYIHSDVESLRGELAKLRLVPCQPANVVSIAAYRQTA